MPKRTRRVVAPQPAMPPARGVPFWVFPLVLVLAGAWAYGTSYRGVLVLDDIRAIARNQTIRTLLPLSVPLSPPTGSTVAARPIANLSFAINYALAPADVRDVFAPGGPGAPAGTEERFLDNLRGYHVGNLLIHLSAALLLFGCLRRTLPLALANTSAPTVSLLAFAIAAVWTVHPLQTESVTYVVQRVESLMGLFLLLTLYAAIRADEGTRWWPWSIVGVTACALGMGTKEVMAVAPLVVAAWYFLFGGRERERRRRQVFLTLGLAAGWLLLAALLIAEHRAASIATGGSVIWQYLLTQAEIITHYLRLSVVPSPLVFLYTWPLTGSFWEAAPYVAFVGALVVATLFALVRRQAIGFAGAFFFLILGPSSSLLPIVTEVAAEHRMYLPLAAVVSLLVLGAWRLGSSVRGRLGSDSSPSIWQWSAVGVLAVVVLGLGLMTRDRNRDYWSEERLWADTVAKQPSNQRALVAYGVALGSSGRFSEAEQQLRAAVAIDAADPFANSRLGSVLAAQGRFDEAVGHFERALAARPDDVDVNRMLGQVYARRRDDARAVQHLERALQGQGREPALLADLASIYADSRDPAVRNGARAVALAERAAEVTGRRNPLVLNVLSAALAATGRYADATAVARDGLALARAAGNQRLAAELEYRTKAYSQFAR